MKNLSHKKTHYKLLAILAVVIFILLLIGAYFSVKTLSNWFNSNEIKVNQMVKVEVKPPFEIVMRKPEIERVVLDYPQNLIDTPIKKYICDKFGPFDCKTALGIVQAESGFRDDAIGVNTDKSVDLGCWQINFPTHSKTISPKDALDCKIATDWAYAKYKRDGNFNAWVTYTNGKYLLNLASL